MLLTTFPLKPHDKSPRHIDVEVYSTAQSMQDAAHAAGALSGTFQAAWAGLEKGERRNRGSFGTVYLFINEDVPYDALHEFVHAAAHYVRDVRGLDLNAAPTGDDAAPGEELLAATVEHFAREFKTVMERRHSRMRNKLAHPA